MPPAEPPPKESLAGSAFMSSTSCCIVLYFESERTKIASGSVVSAAIGVVFDRSVGDLLVSIAPIITRPMTISSLDLPACLDASCESPIVPPAPGTL